MRFHILPITLLASTVAADGAAIIGIMSVISNATTKFTADLNNWTGDLLGAIPILLDSITLLDDINKGTQIARFSLPLSNTTALSVATSTETLVSSVQAALNAIAASKSKFDGLSLDGLALSNLQSEKKASDEFSAAVIEKIPSSLQSAAQNLVAPLDPAFDAAIDTYS